MCFCSLSRQNFCFIVFLRQYLKNVNSISFLNRRLFSDFPLSGISRVRKTSETVTRLSLRAIINAKDIRFTRIKTFFFYPYKTDKRHTGGYGRHTLILFVRRCAVRCCSRTGCVCEGRDRPSLLHASTDVRRPRFY